jgi:hypothetical protein
MYIKRADDGHGAENYPKTEWTIMTKQYNIFLRRTQGKTNSIPLYIDWWGPTVYKHNWMYQTPGLDHDHT